MKRTYSLVAESDSRLGATEENFKDVYFPADPTGEISVRVQTRWVFESAGYAVLVVEKPSCHAVWVVKLNRKSAPRFADDAQFIQHVRQVLRPAGIRLRKADVMARRTGDRCFVSFLWPVPSSGRRGKTN